MEEDPRLKGWEDWEITIDDERVTRRRGEDVVRVYHADKRAKKIRIVCFGLIAALILFGYLLVGCSSTDMENIGIWKANQDHARICTYGGGVC